MYESINILNLFSIPTYNLFIGLGILAGFVYFEKSIKIDNELSFKLINILFFSLFFAFLGSRLFDIYFFEKSFSYYNIINGSSAFLGGVLFAIIFISVFSKIYGIRIFSLLNILCIPLVIGHFFGRIGCFLGGCCFGKTCSSSFLFGVNYPESSIPYQFYNSNVYVHPTQLYEALGLLLIFIFIKNYKNKLSGYLILYGILRFIIEIFRNDERGSFIYDVLSPSQLISISMIFFGIIIIFLNSKRIIIFNKKLEIQKN